MLGGSDGLSALSLIRGSRFDYDEWEKQGAKGWGYNDVLQYFRKMENIQDPEQRKSGEIYVNVRQSQRLLCTFVKLLNNLDEAQLS